MLAEAVLKHARSYLGVHEEPPGSNDGPMIRQWLANVGIHSPAPWCAAFAYSMFAFGAGECGLSNPCPKTASALRMWELADEDYRRHFPAVGSLIVFGHVGADGKPDGHGHVGIVSAVDGYMVSSIEGNSDASGSRTGGAVVEHTSWDVRAGRRGPLILHGFLQFEASL